MLSNFYRKTAVLKIIFKQSCPLFARAFVAPQLTGSRYVYYSLSLPYMYPCTRYLSKQYSSTSYFLVRRDLACLLTLSAVCHTHTFIHPPCIYMPPLGDATDDWSVLSGGGDGTVAHWSVLGLANRLEEGAGGGKEDRDIRFLQIGGYEVNGTGHFVLLLSQCGGCITFDQHLFFTCRPDQQRKNCIQSRQVCGRRVRHKMRSTPHSGPSSQRVRWQNMLPQRPSCQACLPGASPPQERTPMMHESIPLARRL